MTTKQDKKPVPFIKADLIKRVNRYNVGNTSCLELRHACNYISHHYVERKFNQDLYFKSDYKSIEAVNHNYKRKEKLASRLEREFLRKEEKEKETERTITIVSYDIENMEFIKVVGTFSPSLLVNVLNRMRTKIFFEKFLTNGRGTYIFGIEAKEICDYKFKLIDFKPLEK